MSRAAGRVFDEYLAAAARAGDRAALSQLAGRWQPKLLAHAYRLTGEREAARDVAQDAWADIVSGLFRLDDARLFPAWAYRIVTRRAADMIRKRQKSRRIDAAYLAEPRESCEAGRQMEAAADAGPLRHAMTTLPAEQRAAIALFYMEDFSVAEIAAALNIPAGTVKTRLMHARRKLRKALEGGQDNG